MKILATVVFLLAFAVFKGFLLEEATDLELDFPTLDLPQADTQPDCVEATDVCFRQMDTGCSGVTDLGDCLTMIGNVIANVALALFYAVLFLISLVAFLFGVAKLLLWAGFSGIPGVPTVINGLITAVFAVGTALAIYRAIRSGETSA